MLGLKWTFLILILKDNQISSPHLRGLAQGSLLIPMCQCYQHHEKCPWYKPFMFFIMNGLYHGQKNTSFIIFNDLSCIGSVDFMSCKILLGDFMPTSVFLK